MILPTFNRNLLPFKAAYFFYFFSYLSILPFTPVFLRQIGFNVEQVGIINGSRMFVQCLTIPLWGIIADKTRKHRFLLLIQIIFSTLLMFLTPWIPKILPKDNVSVCTATEVQNMTAYQLQEARNSKARFETIINKTRKTDIVNLTYETIINKTRKTDILNLTLESSNNLNNSNIRNCQVKDEINKGNIYLFTIILIIMNTAAMFDGGIPLLLDTLLMEMIKRETAASDGRHIIDFGKQRFWSGVGFVLAPLSTGLGVQLSGSGKANYLTMFFIYLGSNTCLLLVCLQLRQLDDENVGEKEKTKVGKGLLYILRHFDALIFFSTIFVEGLASALLMGFSFWFIKDLGGTEILMGVSNAVGGTSSVIAFLISTRMIKFVGSNLAAINLAILAYSVRFIAMSYLTKAWYILFLQLFQGICFAILWVAATSHASLLAPPGLTTTFLGILSGIHFGLSAGVSILFGGIWYKKYGGRSVFRGFSAIFAIWCFILFLYILSSKTREKQKSKSGHSDLTANNETELKLLNTSAMKDNPGDVDVMKA